MASGVAAGRAHHRAAVRTLWPSTSEPPTPLSTTLKSLLPLSGRVSRQATFKHRFRCWPLRQHVGSRAYCCRQGRASAAYCLPRPERAERAPPSGAKNGHQTSTWSARWHGRAKLEAVQGRLPDRFNGQRQDAPHGPLRQRWRRRLAVSAVQLAHAGFQVYVRRDPGRLEGGMGQRPSKTTSICFLALTNPRLPEWCAGAGVIFCSDYPIRRVKRRGSSTTVRTS